MLKPRTHFVLLPHHPSPRTSSCACLISPPRSSYACLLSPSSLALSYLCLPNFLTVLILILSLPSSSAYARLVVSISFLFSSSLLSSYSFLTFLLCVYISLNLISTLAAYAFHNPYPCANPISNAYPYSEFRIYAYSYPLSHL